ncbi:MAG: acyl-CoA dehydrogenase [Rhodobacteraceae bacterium]|nr:acyl-CoA dehydrogenase [Paracoccaceae bacterium]
MSDSQNPILENLPALCNEALSEIASLLEAVKNYVKGQTNIDGRVNAALLEENQYIVHGFSWLTTYEQSLSALVNWHSALVTNGLSSKLSQLTLQIGFSEFLVQIYNGIPMSQGEFIRLEHFLEISAQGNAAKTLIKSGNSDAARKALTLEIILQSSDLTFGHDGLEEEYGMIRDQFRKFVEKRISPFAHEWHLKDELIPDEIIQEMGELGVFGLTIPEEFGGFGMSKTAMCVVTEELARGYIGVGSLGTRSEIAAELILCGGTDAQKAQWLPQIADASILPTAVFTEPNTGSDLGSLNTRALRKDDHYSVTGAKTWITHAARADIMTMLVRTDIQSTDYNGLSMLLAEKPRGNNDEDFPAENMFGSEIEVLGYRGMKEFELGFDGFEVKAENLLGGVEGQGFKQLMKTFEAARIQTAARAVGVAQNALEVSLKYAQDRKQFGKQLIEFPRVYSKIAMMAVEITIARQLTYFAAKEKDQGRRCDLEAGMAKLLAARVAWAAADNGVQIHGGNGFALEYPISRILCDARILSIFEGAAEIQATVIARRLLA